MESIQKTCSCTGRTSCNSDIQAEKPKEKPFSFPRILIGLLGAGLWYQLYINLEPLSRFITFNLFGLTQGSHQGDAIQFFIYDTPKVMMLLILVVYLVGIIRTFFTPERTRKYLTGKRESVGNMLASFLGVLTPFCSCSAVPLFVGFITAGVPLGVTLSFLIAAPMVNEIALILLYGLLGWKIAGLYLLTGLTVAVVSGWAIGRLGMERYIEEWALDARSTANNVSQENLSWDKRLEKGWLAVKDVVGKVWVYVIAGIAIGAGIHGYVPEGFMASIMGKDAWWSVPVAVISGIPMYSSHAGVIPVVQALLGKGAALGTVLAFMMSVVALSLPEMVILRKILKPQLLATFVAVVGLGIVLVGVLFNIVI